MCYVTKKECFLEAVFLSFPPVPPCRWNPAYSASNTWPLIHPHTYTLTHAQRFHNSCTHYCTDVSIRSIIIGDTATADCEQWSIALCSYTEKHTKGQRLTLSNTALDFFCTKNCVFSVQGHYSYRWKQITLNQPSTKPSCSSVWVLWLHVSPITCYIYPLHTCTYFLKTLPFAVKVTVSPARHISICKCQ